MMRFVRMETHHTHDAASFHDVWAKAFGFPASYGRSFDAWVDCMSDLRLDSGMTSILLGQEEVLTIELPDVEGLRKRCPDILNLLMTCIGDVNQRFVADGQRPAISLVLC